MFEISRRRKTGGPWKKKPSSKEENQCKTLMTYISRELNQSYTVLRGKHSVHLPPMPPCHNDRCQSCQHLKHSFLPVPPLPMSLPGFRNCSFGVFSIQARSASVAALVLQKRIPREWSCPARALMSVSERHSRRGLRFAGSSLILWRCSSLPASLKTMVAKK